MVLPPALLAAALFLLTLALLLRLEPGVLLSSLVIMLAADVGLLFGLGDRPAGLIALALLGLAGLATPAERITPRLGRRRRRRLLPPSEKEPLEERYQILGKLGTGGMATVYRAKRRADGLVAALKVPQERYASEPRFLRRLHREAEVLKKLHHPNIVKVYEHGQAGSTHFLALELVDGPGLDELIADRRLDPELAVRVLLPVAEALKYMHDHGFLHRDLKPGNIMIYRSAIKDGEIDPAGVRLMDFGIAAGKEFARLTTVGARIGTPTYMSPEQARGRPLDEKSDVYSLGVVLYEALTGEAPFQGDFEQVAQKQIFERPVPPIQKNPKIPPALNDLVLRMLEKEPEKRPNLEQVIATLKSAPEAGPRELGGGFLLAAVVEARAGSIRLLNAEGLPVRAFGREPPGDLAGDGEGYLWAVYFEFSGNRGMVRRYRPEGQEVLAVGTYGLKLGEFFNPVAVAVSRNDRVFVLDSETQAITRLDLEGRAELRFGGAGPGRGTFTEARALAAWDDLFVLDVGNRQVQRLDLDGHYQDRFVFATSADDPTPRTLLGIGVDLKGNLLVYDADARKVRRLSPEGRILASYPLPLADDEDPAALVDLAEGPDGELFALRRGSPRIYRLAPEPGVLEIGLPLRALALWLAYRP